MEVPDSVSRQLSDDEQARLMTWWMTLDADERRALVGSWAADAPSRPELDDELMLLLEPRFIDPSNREHQRNLEENYEAYVQRLEYIRSHPEYKWSLEVRNFHICRAHRRARAAVETGRLRADFECPLARDSCPMRRLLDLRPGHDVELAIVGLRSGRALPSSHDRPSM
ncbi:MAG: hypothetical protein AAF799_38905 [Myxococcota bacterium]